jgi:hypothetical protein
MVESRNASVIGQLLAAYNGQIPGGALRVYCVSNTDYWKKRKLSKNKALPLLRLSGILDLRRHCLSIVSESQFRVVTQYVRDEIPALIGDIQLWVQSGAGSASAEVKQATLKALDGLETQLKKVSERQLSRSPVTRTNQLYCLL